MQPGPIDLAQVRFNNALALFEEFVRATAKHADAATLRGLERRFAERVQIQPSYWSQIKGRSRQIGERLARQFEQLCHKPAGWMDRPHASLGSDVGESVSNIAPGDAAPAPAVGTESTPRDDDERFIVGLVLTYYRRHPQRARTRLLDLLGEVLVPQAALPPVASPSLSIKGASGTGARPTPPTHADDAMALWQRTQQSVAPLKRKK